MGLSWDRFISSNSHRRKRGTSNSASRPSPPTSPTANTPGFKARDVEPFNKVLDGMPVRLATTSPTHMQLSATETDTRATSKKDSWDVVHSGNSVSLEQEMIKGNDVNRDYSMNSAVVRSFHRMLLSSVKT